jgi:ABC-type sugar transport system ATPase subunit
VIKTIHVKQFTVFEEAALSCGRNLNVFVGENGAGKTHLLKLAYPVLATSAEEGRKPNASAPVKSSLQAKLGEKLVGVFRPESLGHLVRRDKLRERGDVSMILIAHNYVHVFEVCDRVNLLRNGRITFDKKTSETSVEEVTDIVATEYRTTAAG